MTKATFDQIPSVNAFHKNNNGENVLNTDFEILGFVNVSRNDIWKVLLINHRDELKSIWIYHIDRDSIEEKSLFKINQIHQIYIAV